MNSTKNIVASAPGKLFLTGDYAVLAGAPALVVATPQRVIVHAEISSVSLAEEERSSRLYDLEQALRSSFAYRGWRYPASLSLKVDSSALYHCGASSELKLGLGSSAACTVAIAAAAAWLSDESYVDFDLLCAVHDALQGSGGSHADVATSWLGGWCVAQREELPYALNQVELGDLKLMAVWTGAPKQTAGQLQKLRKPAARQIFLTYLPEFSEHSKKCILSVEENNSKDFVESYGRYAESLHAFDKEVGFGIYSDKHLYFATVAKKYRLAYKPSGAGGGDMGVAIGLIDDIQAFRDDLDEQGYFLFELGQDAVRAGLVLDGSSSQWQVP